MLNGKNECLSKAKNECMRHSRSSERMDESSKEQE